MFRGGLNEFNPATQILFKTRNHLLFLWIISNDASVGIVLEQACRLQSQSLKYKFNCSKI
jgi:hypothetical protein